MEKISVIIPVYRVEAYLERCIRSVVGQTYENLEIILVDDGSPDRCPAMCDAWAQKDERIRVIHKENGGLSDARNAGMRAASGELIGFIDSDDWIEPDMYEQLYRQMCREQADMAACGVQMEWEDGTSPRALTYAGSRTLERREAMQAIIEESWLKQPVWYKLYRTELVRDLPFETGKCHEDVFWSYQAIHRANRVAVFDALGYHYTQRASSIMGTGYSAKRLDGIEAKQRRQDFLEKHYPELALTGKRDLFFSCLYQMQQDKSMLDSAVRKDIERRLEKAMRSVVFTESERKQLDKKSRIWARLAALTPRGTCRMRSMLKIGI